MSDAIFGGDAVGFMQNNIVLPGTFTPDKVFTKGAKGICKSVGGLYWMKLAKSVWTGSKQNGGSCGVYRLERGVSNGADSFQAYWCSYSDDDLETEVVDDDANYMFTPVMNGCTFGVGSPGSSGARLVGHVNVSRSANTQEGFNVQEARQSDFITQYLGDTALLLQPSQYTPFGSGRSGTTFGVRRVTTGQWKFYSQVWTKTGSTTVMLTDFVTLGG